MTDPVSNQFLGLSSSNSGYKPSSVVILPIPLEKTTSYMKGTARGPSAIIEASTQVEFLDPEFQEELWQPGIHTLPAMNFDNITSEESLARIESATGKILADGKFPILLGGEHALTGGSVAAMAKKYPDLSILQIDAHADYRESYEGSPYSHACAMRLAANHVDKIVGVGIRSLCKEELEFVKPRHGLKLMFDHIRRHSENWIEEAIGGLSENVYITIDVDGFSPELIPATGTPEPGGLTWYEGLDLLKTVFQRKNVVAADVVELLPMQNQHASSFTVAKLVYKLISYWKKYK